MIFTNYVSILEIYLFYIYLLVCEEGVKGVASFEAIKATHHQNHSHQNDQIDKIISTTSGLVKGNTIHVLNKTIDEYIGIPYAEPPVGSLRFAKPKPISKPIEGVIDATKAKKSCLQSKNPFGGGEQNTDEDCLFLNIWSTRRVQTPDKSDNKLKAVMVWFHGGSLATGSIFRKDFNGSVLATHEVVVVTTAYRVGWFGFLYGGDESAPGNIGFFDQTLALRWVRDNIHLFGGDKNMVTIFGQSAGSWGVSAHILSPVSKGLFKRAILKAGAHLYNRDRPVYSREEGLSKAKEHAQTLGCTGDTWLKCLREVDPHQIKGSFQIFYPVDGTEFLPLMARQALEQGHFNKAGITINEGSAVMYFREPGFIFKPWFTLRDFRTIMNSNLKVYHNFNVEKMLEFYLDNTNTYNKTAIKWRMYEFVGHLTMICPTYFFAKLFAEHSSNQTNAYFYELTHSAYQGKYFFDFGVHHGSDFELLFGHPLLFPNSATDRDIEFSKEYMKLFTDFAKNGKPDNEWPELVGTEALPAMELIRDLNPNHKSKYNKDLFRDSCNGIWKGYF